MHRVETFEAGDVDNLQYKMNNWFAAHAGFQIIQVIFNPPYLTNISRMNFTAIIHYKN